MAHPLLLRNFTAALVVALPFSAEAQWVVRESGTRASLRGLSIVDESVVWASGQRGTVLRSVDGGDSWADVSIAGAAAFDVRAIHARSALVAHAAATAGRIWRTTDGGKTWTERYSTSDTSVFLDAITFIDDRTGFTLGDPIGGRFLMLVTDDSGASWRVAPDEYRPVAAAGEAAFAASGTSLVMNEMGHLWLGTGGSVARVHRSLHVGRRWEAFAAPVASGSSSKGVFSVAMAGDSNGVIVGGDYQHPDSAAGTAAYTANLGERWVPSRSGPRGYRSGVAMRRLNGQLLAVAVGTSGTDYSTDGGQTWSRVDETNLNAVHISPAGIALAVGAGGRIARMDLTKLAGVTRR